jgi:hypothetical protein
LRELTLARLLGALVTCSAVETAGAGAAGEAADAARRRADIKQKKWRAKKYLKIVT